MQYEKHKQLASVISVPVFPSTTARDLGEEINTKPELTYANDDEVDSLKIN